MKSNDTVGSPVISSVAARGLVMCRAVSAGSSSITNQRRSLEGCPGTRWSSTTATGRDPDRDRAASACASERPVNGAAGPRLPSTLGSQS